MNTVLQKVSMLVRDLLTVDEQLIRIGREGFPEEDFETNYIVVDALGPSLSQSSLETYNGTTEVLSLGGVWRGPVTLDFYGNDTYTRAIDFSLRLRSQAGRNLKKSLGIMVYNPKGPTDVKQLVGQQYGERVQLEMTVEYSTDVDIATLRIDTAQIEIQNEDGVQYNG